MRETIARFLDRVLMRQQPGAMHRWGELVAEFGVLWLTFGWLEEIRARKAPSGVDAGHGWDGAFVAWFVLTGVIGVGAMWMGVKIGQDWGRGSDGRT